MSPEEFAELVDWIDDRWGRTETWTGAHRLVADFAPFDAADVWAAAQKRLMDPEAAKYPPRPADLIAGAREEARVRHDPTRKAQLPASTDRSSYSEWCQQTYGEMIPLDDLVRRRHAELEGQLVEEATDARLPMESGLIEDGARPKIQCRSPFCDIHESNGGS